MSGQQIECVGRQYNNAGKAETCEVDSLCYSSESECYPAGTTLQRTTAQGGGPKVSCYGSGREGMNTCCAESGSGCQQQQQAAQCFDAPDMQGCRCKCAPSGIGGHLPCGDIEASATCDQYCSEYDNEEKLKALCKGSKSSPPHHHHHGGHFGGDKKKPNDKKKPSGGGQAGNAGSALSETQIAMGTVLGILGLVLGFLGLFQKSLAAKRILIVVGLAGVIVSVLLFTNVIKLGSSDSFTISHNCCM